MSWMHFETPWALCPYSPNLHSLLVQSAAPFLPQHPYGLPGPSSCFQLSLETSALLAQPLC